MPEYIILADGSLAVKGRNLLKGFTKTIPDLWSNNSAHWPIAGNISSTVDGYVCKRVSRTEPEKNPSVISLYNTIPGSQLTIQKLKGETITVSCYVRASSETTCTLMATLLDGSNNINNSGGSFAIGPEWTQIHMTISMGFNMSNQGMVRISPFVVTIPESQRDGSFWVEYSRIKLEFGTEATPFSYAPEDEPNPTEAV